MFHIEEGSRREAMDANRSTYVFSAFSSLNPQIQNLINPVEFPLLPNHQVVDEKQELDEFWNQQLLAIYNDTELKNELPVSRIRRIMKIDKDVKMVSGETPLLFSKACELLIAELTFRAWQKAKEDKHSILKRSDFAKVIRDDYSLTFLLDLLPLTEARSEGAGPEGGAQNVQPRLV